MISYLDVDLSYHIVHVHLRESGKIRKVVFFDHPGWSLPALAALYEPTRAAERCICILIAHSLMTSHVKQALTYGDKLPDPERSEQYEAVTFYNRRLYAQRLRTKRTA